MKFTRMSSRQALRTLIIVFLDVLTLFISGFMALWIRFDFSLNQGGSYFSRQAEFAPLVIITFVAVYYAFKLYSSIWTFASVAELSRIIGAYIVLIPVMLLEIAIFHISLPRSSYVIAYVINFCCCCGIRFSYRFFRVFKARRIRDDSGFERVMIIGAGAAARELVGDILTSDKVNYKVVCIIDDNPGKKGRYLGSVPIVGDRSDIVEQARVNRIDRIIFAIPSMRRPERAEILEMCKSTGCHTQIVPGLYQLTTGELTVSRLKDVDIIDLLGRDEITVNNDEIFRAIHDRIVMVTGGGGSIGSELCRQIAAAGPRHLLVVDIYENNAYAIEQELKRSYPNLNLSVLIGSIRSTGRMKDILETYGPEIIYNAAAHKHVPLMENSPNEAVKNNIMGTYKLATLAGEYGVSRFLQISTDKAVNPTNVMGASKRVCEMIIQMMDRKYPGTSYSAVRFGNVLGSNGSVIPLFRKQIEEGGPVTVTDKRIIRYFMTIPEAVSLVLQSAHYARGGEIFVFDMGEPVRIDDMAHKMIELSGLRPGVDIQIEYTGLRPGEKLYEEMILDREHMYKTENNKIFIEPPMDIDDEKLERCVHLLDEAARAETGAVRELIKEVVPEYTYS
ncbi:MAG: polysaccharide biosynthesis protein [Eubacterium sp.]|nr:polysaccharide biosynthesis protein [Eubacterium sp.]